MEKVITFDASKDTDRRLFETLWDGVILGGSRGEAKTKQELRHWAVIQRKLKAIGEVTSDYNHNERPLDPLVLTPGTHTITLEQGDIEDIEKRLEKFPWPGSKEIDVADLLDFLSAAPVKDEVKK